MQNSWFIVLIISLISGCSTANWQQTESDSSITKASYRHPSNTLHAHVEMLARQLFVTSEPIDGSKTLAIGTILPTMANSGELLPEHAAFGLQIQESLLTFSTQAGLKVIEYKTMPSIKISDNADTMLSRNVSDLTKDISTDYFLTGTYTLQENTTMVNIRLIKVPENIVLAAATDYVPNDALWSQSKISLKNNHIYRNAY